MAALNFIHSTVSLFFLGIAVYVVYKNKNALLHLLVFSLLLCFSIWSFSIYLVQNPLVNKGTADIFVHIGNLANIGYGIFIFLSISAFTNLLKLNKVVYALFVVYFTAILIFQLRTNFASVVSQDNSGLRVLEYNNQVVYLLVSIIHNTLILASFFMLIRFIRGNTNPIQKKQSQIILITGLISFILASLNVFLPLIFPQITLPLLVDLCMIIFAIGLVYSIVKYDLFDIVPGLILNQIIDFLPAGLVITNTTGQIVRINESLLNITHRRKRDFEGKDIKTIMSSLTGNNYELTEKSNFTEKLTIEIDGTATRHLLMYYSKIFDEYKRHIGAVLLIQDIEQLFITQKKLEELNHSLEQRIEERTVELLLAKEKAEESDRLKTAFLHNISHEIRTPLNAISGFSGLLNNNELSIEKRKEFISIIQNSSDQLASIVNDILTMSSLETKQMRCNYNKVCINVIITELLETFKPHAKEKQIALSAKLTLTDKQSEIFTDKTKLIQILTNLLTNALKFTHDGFIDFGYILKKNELEFYVKDSGIGIDAKDYKRIFERFGKIDTSGTTLYGTGIGLSISKEYIELLGGKIWVLSEPGKGTSFCFTIPYTTALESDKANSIITE